LNYKILPTVTAQGGYSEANRAPTPLEIDCADSNRPCILENSLVSDPPIKQVVAHTVDAGLRGGQDVIEKGRGIGRPDFSALTAPMISSHWRARFPDGNISPMCRRPCGKESRPRQIFITAVSPPM